MRTATTKRVITIIAMTILICVCCAVIQGRVYADQSNQEKFNKDYTWYLTGNGADDIVAVAKWQLEKNFGKDLGYQSIFNRGYEFIADCAALAGQGDVLNTEVFAPCYVDGLNKVSDPQKGDIVVGSNYFAGIVFLPRFVHRSI